MDKSGAPDEGWFWDTGDGRQYPAAPKPYTKWHSYGADNVRDGARFDGNGFDETGFGFADQKPVLCEYGMRFFFGNTATFL